MSDKRYLIPPVDIYETNDKYIVYLDMPGTTKENIEINLEGDSLTVQAKVFEVDKEWKPVTTEFELRDYKRVFTIGNKINREKIDAKYENGVLKLELEKSEAAKPRKIPIKM